MSDRNEMPDVLRPSPPSTPVHHYVSTACQHGLHDRCRESCKYCAAACQCAVCEHWNRQPPADPPGKRPLTDDDFARIQEMGKRAWAAKVREGNNT